MILFDLNGRGFLNLDEPRLTLIPFDDQIKVTSKVDLIKDCRWQQLFYKGQQHLESGAGYFKETGIYLQLYIQLRTRVVLQDLESKKAHFYIFCSDGSADEKLRKPLFYKS